jgi:hypothetical protein
MLRVLFRDLRGTSLTEISGTGGKRHDTYLKSSQATGTSRGVDVEAAVAMGPVPPNDDDDNNNALRDPPTADAASEETETLQKTPWWKPWGSFWDAGMGSWVPRALRRKSVSAPATRQEPFALAENSSQRVLVQTSAAAGESAQEQEQEQRQRKGEARIIQTQEFELTYAERRPRRASSPGYELERVGIGEAR